MKIADLIYSKKEGGYSLEFFPPKTPKGIENLTARVERFYAIDGPKPLFIDLTWGAGGSTSQTTLDLSSMWNKMVGVNVNMHITCTNMQLEKLNSSLIEARSNYIENLVALRGDPPQLSDKWSATDSQFTCALDLVKHIRKIYGRGFNITVAGYPEGHIDVIKKIEKDDLDTLSESEKARLRYDYDSDEYLVCRDDDYLSDIKYLKSKIDAGGDMIITQLFFDPQVFIQFCKDCRSVGITCPILPGIMLFQNVAGFKKMTKMCKTRVPNKIWDDISELTDDKDVVEYGIKLGKEMCKELYDSGVRFFHLYTLNKEDVAKPVIQYIVNELLHL